MGDRGVSVVVNYVLMLGIVTLLGAGLFVAAGDFVEDQQEAAIRSQLEVAGNRLAADIGAADRLVRATEGDGTVSIEARLPERVAASGYWVRISSVSSDRYELVLASTDPEVVVRVYVRSRTDVTTGTVRGGPLTLHADVVDGTPGELEVGHG